MNIKQTLRSMALGAALLAAGASTSYGATGNTDVTVTVPKVIILDYFEKINISLPEVSESFNHGDYDISATWTGGSFTDTDALTQGNLTTSTTNGLDGNTIDLVLQNTWAVRGLSSLGTATVSISQPTSFVNGASSITVSNVKIQTHNQTTNVGPGTSLGNVPLNGIPKANATLGDILMSLDLSGTTRAGAHTGTLTITATAN